MVVFVSYPVAPPRLADLGLVDTVTEQSHAYRLLQRLATGTPVHGVSVHMSLLSAEVVAELHRHVEVVMTWPVNDVAALDAMLAIGVTGIISDDPTVLAELVSRRPADT